MTSVDSPSYKVYQHFLEPKHIPLAKCRCLSPAACRGADQPRAPCPREELLGGWGDPQRAEIKEGNDKGTRQKGWGGGKSNGARSPFFLGFCSIFFPEPGQTVVVCLRQSLLPFPHSTLWHCGCCTGQLWNEPRLRVVVGGQKGTKWILGC